MVRIQKYLRDIGVGSLRECDRLVQSKCVYVNNNLVDTPSIYLKENDIITVNNKNYTYKSDSDKEFYYIKINKPKGIISTKNDEYFRKNIFDLLKVNYKNTLNYAGRLDKNSSGLMVLSSDGDFIYKLTHPKYNIIKEYYVKANYPVNFEQLKKISNGVIIDGVKYSNFNFNKISEKELFIYLNEGKKHEIRNIIVYIKNVIDLLIRTKIGNIELGSMKEGEYKFIEPDIIKNITEL